MLRRKSPWLSLVIVALVVPLLALTVGAGQQSTFREGRSGAQQLPPPNGEDGEARRAPAGEGEPADDGVAGTEVTVVLGTEGANLLTGTDGNDILRGFAGADRIIAGQGDDVLFGGPGGDLLRGGAGTDKLLGELGPDVLRGGLGDDRLFGGFARDELYGQGGNDILRGGLGADLLHGGSGEDRFFAESGNDRVVSRDRIAETVHCGRGFDTAIVDRKDKAIGCEVVKRPR